MKGSIKLFKLFGISINIHVTFLLLLVFFLSGGIKWLVLLLGVFCFVTLHEICHSLVAKSYGIEVREITLLPIGGVASMSSMPEKPSQEFFISIAGPLFNLMVVAVFYIPLKKFLGAEVLFYRPFSTATWPLTLAYLYWINLILALFNLIPAFPMDGGRVLRSLLAQKMGYQKATKLAVNLGHIFALGFAYFGIVGFNIILIAIAIFIYIAASNEGLQVDLKETLKRFKVKDILSADFFTLNIDTTLAKVMELVLHSHQEDFPVTHKADTVGFVTRNDVLAGIHSLGADATVGEIMRKDFPKIADTDSLVQAQKMMEESGLRAIPVTKGGKIIGIVTIEDIGRVYSIASQRNK
ncbi:MAG: site-2 protease family protein [Candidatus Omnitrophota bacterium]|nr:site-2 protease family protein [Candidatus Omnitrophota bacterium]